MHLSQDQIKIIQIQEQDFPAFSQLLEWRRTGQEEGDATNYQTEKVMNFMDQYRVLKSDQFFIYAAKVENKLVGYINAILIPKPDPRLGTMYVDELWVPEIYRQNGIAELLMKEVFRKSKDLDLRSVRLYVDTYNQVARNFYQKVGYQEKGDSIFCEVNVTDLKI